MRTHLIAAAIATLGLALGAQSASAFERHFWVETERGTISGSTDVYCFDGACYREAEITGVNGNMITVRFEGAVAEARAFVTARKAYLTTRLGL